MNQPVLTPEQRAELNIRREMKRRTSTSIFDAGGNLDEHRARSMATDGQVYLGEYLDLSLIPFAPDPDGSDHCTYLSRLAEYMAQLPANLGGVVGGPLDKHDQKVLHAVAILYAVGKTHGVHGFEARSAAFAEQFFRLGGGAGTYWGKESVREETCRLIFKHNDPAEIRGDKRLQIFADALRYELARLGQNTGPGMALLKEQWKPELFHCGWARDKANARTYMVSRGWR